MDRTRFNPSRLYKNDTQKQSVNSFQLSNDQKFIQKQEEIQFESHDTFMNQKKTCDDIEKLIHHDMGDNDLISWSKPVTKRVNNLIYIRGSEKIMSCSNMGIKQVMNESVPSPEAISSLTVCSDVEGQFGKEYIDNGPTLCSSNYSEALSSSSMSEILNSYENYKNMPTNIGGNTIPFENYFHWNICTWNICKCDEYKLLISHLNNCDTTNCSVCRPKLGLHSVSASNDNSSSVAIDREILHTTKRMKTECGPAPVISAPYESDRYSHKKGPFGNNQVNVLNSSEESRRSGLGKSDEEVNSSSEVASSSKMIKTEGLICKEETQNTVPKCENTTEAERSKNIFSVPISKKIDVPLVDHLNTEQLEQHISSLNGNNSKCDLDINTCQLCALTKLVFNPSPIYCSYCTIPIKRNLFYYSEINGQPCLCTRCFKYARAGNITLQGGVTFCKENMIKKKNDEEKEESWVECDKCERWFHQICALYNAKNDPEGNARYICPYCRLQDIKDGKHVPFASFGAKDLPRTKLSDHLEQRLFTRLKRERLERAKSLGKKFDEVPGATDLVVRVVLSVKKQLKVNQQFLDIFHGQNYPSEFAYRSKVILLFQKSEGVDICLFGMYVQEYGSDCGAPNKRSVYISYLDSVKYFHPQIETVNGEALRTYVYHEILIGYLDYCKKRGFTTGYIWACPPIKGEDYILNCHPETQKTPKPDKLRQWYKSVLNKAGKEGIVVNSTNLYDRFFVPDEKRRLKVSAARLPYFEGGYWSGSAEDIIKKLGTEKNGGTNKLMTKRSLKAMGYTDLSTEAATDVLVMQKLGQMILPSKEDFIIVHMHITCSTCHEVILSKSYWNCTHCQSKSFHLCPRCVNKDRTHVSIDGERHLLAEVKENVIAEDTEDKDVIVVNEILENRHSFLSFCQENSYEFGTLRRAKHSSMMILSQLHKQTLLKSTCNICYKDNSVDENLTCEICPSFYVCNSCYTKYGSSCHTHKLLNKDELIQIRKAIMEKEHLSLLDHALFCTSEIENPCEYPKCFQMRKLFNHASYCNVKYQGGCTHCRKVWTLLLLHTKNCTDLNCQVTRCKDIKKKAEFNSRQQGDVQGMEQ